MNETVNDYLDGIPNGREIVSKSFGNYRMFIGTFKRTIDIIKPGKDLSQPAIPTKAS